MDAWNWNAIVSRVKETTDKAGDFLQEAATKAAPHLEKLSGDVKSLAGKAAEAAADLAQRVEREVGPARSGKPRTLSPDSTRLKNRLCSAGISWRRHS